MADSKLCSKPTNDQNQHFEKKYNDLTQSLKDTLLQHGHGQCSRTDHVDVGVQVEATMAPKDTNNKAANEYYAKAVTALIHNDLHQAESYLIQSSQACRRDTVTIMMEQVRHQITQTSPSNNTPDLPETSDPNMAIVESFIQIAKNAFSAEDFAKSEEFLNKAEKIKPTTQAQQLLKDIHTVFDKRRKQEQSQAAIISAKLMEHATNAIDADEYDVAELLLITAWIQYKSESAKRMLEMFIQCEGVDQKIRRTKFIVNRTAEKQKAVAEKYRKLAENMINADVCTEETLKIAELMLVIAGNTHENHSDDHSATSQMLTKIHNSLYANRQQYVISWEWGMGYPADSIEQYKCVYFTRMAFRALKYADNPKLGHDFLMEAKKVYPQNDVLAMYFNKVMKNL